jgi:ABC-type bacteriocin/lantibiotic exporter with double-glycine peptidase domain
MTPRSTGFSNLARLIGLFSKRRRVQFAGVLALTLIGAIAELVSVGVVLPVLQLIAAPRTLGQMPFVGPLLVGYINRPADLLVPAALLLAGAAIASALIRVVLIWATSRYVAGLTHDLAMIVFSRVIHQPYGVFIRRNSAEVLSGIEKVGIVGSYLLNPLLTALSSIMIACGIISLLFIVSPAVAVLAGGTMALLYGVIALFTRPMLLRGGKRLAATSTARVKLTQESLGGIRDIILDRSHRVFEWQFRIVDANGRRASAQQNTVSLTPRYLVEGIGIVMIAALAIFYQGKPGGVVAAIPILGMLALSAQRLLPLVQNVNTAWVQYAATVGYISDIFRLVDAPILGLQGGQKIAPFRDAIELREVGFNYASDIVALRSIDMRIVRGQRVGIMGTTGSGKSTLIDIVMGLLDPSTGQLVVDGRPIDQTNVASWQAQIAHVPQTIFLMDNSIAANIAFGIPSENIDMARVYDSAAKAGVDEFVRSLPEGYDTMVGERGVQLSGGQRQRIGIARALYKRAAVLVLDEATSALDDATEVAVMDAVRQLDANLTVLIVAHRLSTLTNCDVLYRLEQGKIADKGSYVDVLSRRKEGV